MNFLRSLQSSISQLMDYLCEHGRGSEWVLVFVQFYVAYVLILPGDTLQLRTYLAIKEIVWAEEYLAIALIVMGLNHIGALLRNGSWKRSPVWRGVCCFVAALTFGALWFLTQTSPLKVPALSPAFLAGYVILAILGCRQAGDDYKCLKRP